MIKPWLVFTALCLIFAGSAAAQQWSDSMIANVPFDFVVNGTTLPAGTYAVRTYISGPGLMIQNRDKGEYSTIVHTIDVSLSPSSTREGTSFMFLFKNGQHVLHQIRLQGDNHTHGIIHGNGVPELVPQR